jgi:Carboxypeptidase regulatory-like domain
MELFLYQLTINFLQANRGVKGFVKDAVSDQALSNAHIRVEGNNKTVSTSRQFGDFWRLLLPGIYNLTASADGLANTIIICDNCIQRRFCVMRRLYRALVH